MSTAAYYNEIDPYAAQWLRNLIAAGHIAPGDVDERSIEDVKPDDIKHYTQCHFFAGIGVWSYALRNAGWPDDKPVWTGSCPCQPFSSAGKGGGFDDERHLWPHFQRLIGECNPPVVFGEQVASKIVEPWIDLVQTDLEALGYAFGCVPFPSSGVGAPHIRDRAFWVAHSDDDRQQSGSRGGGSSECSATRNNLGRRGSASTLGNSSIVPFRTHDWQQQTGGEQQGQVGGSGISSILADANNKGSQGWGGVPECPVEFSSRSDGLACSTVEVNGFWRDADWLYCRDGKWRPVEPGTFPLAHGVTNRVGRLRAYGNAINAEAAAEFIRAYREAR